MAHSHMRRSAIFERAGYLELDFQPATGDLVIAADAGMRYLEEQGIRAGYICFHIYCGTGGRIDHTMANLQVLAYLSANDMRGFLFDNGTVITAITNGRLCFGEIPCGYVSVFSCSAKAEGVTLCGLKYELHNAVLTNTFPVKLLNLVMDIPRAHASCMKGEHLFFNAGYILLVLGDKLWFKFPLTVSWDINLEFPILAL